MNGRRALAWILLLLVLLGCQHAPSHVVHYGTGVYAVAWSSSAGIGGARAAALLDAERFCAERGLDWWPLHVRSDWSTTYQLTFDCR